MGSVRNLRWTRPCLMAQRPRSRSPMPPSSGTMPAARITALIAEDEPLLRKQLKVRLAQAWPELVIVAEAENGAEAVALASELMPEIAFLDIRMPVKDGIAVAAAIGDDCHVVFVTAY